MSMAAIAPGHLIWTTEAALTTHLIHPMGRDGFERGVVALCIGGGEGIPLEAIA